VHAVTEPHWLAQFFRADPVIFVWAARQSRRIDWQYAPRSRQTVSGFRRSGADAGVVTIAPFPTDIEKCPVWVIVAIQQVNLGTVHHIYPSNKKGWGGQSTVWYQDRPACNLDGSVA